MFAFIGLDSFASDAMWSRIADSFDGGDIDPMLLALLRRTMWRNSKKSVAGIFFVFFLELDIWKTLFFIYQIITDELSLPRQHDVVVPGIFHFCF